ncbi:MAG: PEP-CTERM sorting domain-containing protein [Gemmatimonadaceae bacterium]
MRRTVALSICGVLLVASTSMANAQNIVLNPSFETVDAWQKSTWTIGNTNPLGAHSGSYSAVNPGCHDELCITPYPSTLGSYIYQDLTTVVGQKYDFSFWYGVGAASFDNNGTKNELEVLFGTNTIADLVNVPTTGYKQYLYTVTASASNTRLQFLAGSNGYGFLDDVSMTASQVPPVTTAPEPASFTLMGGGLMAVLFVMRRRRNVDSNSI